MDAVTRRRPPQEGPSLFDVAQDLDALEQDVDVLEKDLGALERKVTDVAAAAAGYDETVDRMVGRAPRRTATPYPDGGVDWAARAAEHREKWAASTAAARAKFENTQGDDRP